MADLYYIGATDPNDLQNDLSLLVSAQTPEQAFELWQGHFFEGATDCSFEDAFIPGEPVGYPRDTTAGCWRVKHDLFHIGVLEWGDPNQLLYLGHRKEKT